MTRRTVALVALLAVVGCGSHFKLASAVTNPAGKTYDQVRLDVLTCQTQARDQSQTSAAQARDFTLGLTLSVIGAAAAYEMDKREQRDEYKRCLEALGYAVTMATD